MNKIEKWVKEFETKEKFQKFLDNSIFCICRNSPKQHLLTGLHEMTCPTIQKIKFAFTGTQDKHPLVRVPNVLENEEEEDLKDD